MLRIIILVIALGAGSLAAWIAVSMQTGAASVQNTTAVSPAVPLDHILVAATNLGQGQALDEKSVKWHPWPIEAISSGFITRSSKPNAIEALKDTVVRSNFVSGEPIREDKLARGPSGLLAALLPSGKRAVAIRVSAESTAGGFVLPNDRVDVLQTISRQDKGRNDSFSRTLLSNIRVLAVDQKAEDAKSGAVVAKTVTLELTPAQTEVITSAQASGALSLALRSAVDSGEEPVVTQEKSNSIRILRAGRSEVVNIQ